MIGQSVSIWKTHTFTSLFTNKLVARYHSSGGVCAKCGQVTTNTHATSDTHRVEYHLDLGLMFPSMNRVQKFEDKISTLMSVPITTAYFFLSLLGLLSSGTDAIPLGRLHLRPLPLYLLSHWATASKDLKALIAVKHDLLNHHLRLLLDRKCTRAGMLLDIPEAQTPLFTDASESGWGAHLDKHQEPVTWDGVNCVYNSQRNFTAGSATSRRKWPKWKCVGVNICLKDLGDRRTHRY